MVMWSGVSGEVGSRSVKLTRSVVSSNQVDWHQTQWGLLERPQGHSGLWGCSCTVVLWLACTILSFFKNSPKTGLMSVFTNKVDINERVWYTIEYCYVCKNDGLCKEPRIVRTFRGTFEQEPVTVDNFWIRILFFFDF